MSNTPDSPTKPPLPTHNETGSNPIFLGFAFAAILAIVLVVINLNKVKYTEKPAQVIAPGVIFREVKVSGGDKTRTLWVYLPEHANPGKTPCIFIAPAGASRYVGSKLDIGSRPEHIPYVREGFAVVAYSIDGSLPDNPTNADAIKAVKAFRAARSGIMDGQIAIDYALENIKNIDHDLLYAAGYSSSGASALMLGESDHRIAGVMAYAPRCNVPASHLHCPVFLFMSKEAGIIDNNSVMDVANVVRKYNKRVSICTVMHGDNYNAMLNKGIPLGIQWLKSGMPAKDSTSQ